jgi:hypothetical protein
LKYPLAANQAIGARNKRGDDEHNTDSARSKPACIAGRIFAAIVGVFAACIGYLLVNRTTTRSDAFFVAIAWDTVTIIGALLAFWFAAFGHITSERGLFRRVLLIGLIVSVIAIGLQVVYMLAKGAFWSFAILVAVLLTAPLGFAAGCIVGFTWVRYRHVKASRIRSMPVERWVDKLREQFFLPEVIVKVRQRMADANDDEFYGLSLVLRTLLMEAGQYGEAERVVNQAICRSTDDVRFPIAKASLLLYL